MKLITEVEFNEVNYIKEAQDEEGKKKNYFIEEYFYNLI